MLMTISLQYSHLLDDPNIDIIMPWFVFQDDPLEETIVNVLASFQKAKEKTNTSRCHGRTVYGKDSKRIEETNVPVYHSVIEWVTAPGALAKWTRVSRPGKVTSYFWTVKYCYLRVVWKSSKPILLENVHYFLP